MVDGEERMVLNNVAYYIDHKGNVLGKYLKKNLWWPEKDYLTAGTEEEEKQEVFETRFGKTSFLICKCPPLPSTFSPSLPFLFFYPFSSSQRGNDDNDE